MTPPRRSSDGLTRIVCGRRSARPAPATLQPMTDTGPPAAAGSRWRLPVGIAVWLPVVALVMWSVVRVVGADPGFPAGLKDLLPNGAVYPSPGVRGSALFSRWPVRDDGLRRNPAEFGQARATVTVAGAAPVAVESVHPCAPSAPDRSGCWAAGLAGQPPATVDGQIRLLIGDFNATLDHRALRRLLATGYRDAADVTGAGLTGTWPMDKPLPKIALDHVLADRRVGVRHFAAYPVPDSDHKAVFAELILPGG
jgi:endonuclease/exonuclease/phosphatase family metal-dependent hydrolase